MSILESNPFRLEFHTGREGECEILDFEVRLRILTGLPLHGRGSKRTPEIEFRDERPSGRGER